MARNSLSLIPAVSAAQAVPASGMTPGRAATISIAHSRMAAMIFRNTVIISYSLFHHAIRHAAPSSQSPGKSLLAVYRHTDYHVRPERPVATAYHALLPPERVPRPSFCTPSSVVLNPYTCLTIYGVPCACIQGLSAGEPQP